MRANLGIKGTPPRVWGKPTDKQPLRGIARYTPTRVGKTCSLVRWWRILKVHPHACGENSVKQRHPVGFIGTPPRVWGKRPGGKPRVALCRYTPTRVGKTQWSAHSRLSYRVHPHACGENLFFLISFTTATGTPPRVWGKLIQPNPRVRWSRYTPTRVGKTLHPDKLDQPDQVHPHACGENGERIAGAYLIAGTPPRVWGKPLMPTYDGVIGRYTPTRVGKTFIRSGIFFGTQVHPHACGENSRQRRYSTSSYGTPPRVWGKP